ASSIRIARDFKFPPLFARQNPNPLSSRPTQRTCFGSYGFVSPVTGTRSFLSLFIWFRRQLSCRRLSFSLHVYHRAFLADCWLQHDATGCKILEIVFLHNRFFFLSLISRTKRLASLMQPIPSPFYASGSFWWSDVQ
ncbi:unnamed protein product, partial [Musa textilis]